MFAPSPAGGLTVSNFSPVSPCFTPGTLIATDRGQQPVETLRRGDKVVTRDNGLRRIYWVGRRDLSFADLSKARRLRPILIRAGALGEGRPARDMIVSPNHRMLREDFSLPGEEDRGETLIAARLMLNGDRILPARTLGVSYIHLLCDRHQVILANGVWTESFHPDDALVKAMENAQRLELMKLFPEIRTIGASVRFPPARRVVDERSRFEL